MMSDTTIDTPIDDTDFGYKPTCSSCKRKLYVKQSIQLGKCEPCRGVGMGSIFRGNVPENGRTLGQLEKIQRGRLDNGRL